MFVTASFPVPTSMSSESLHNLPSSAVMLVGGKHFVFVVDPDGGFTRKQVKITREVANRIEVQGLIDGQRVVTEGNLFLQQIVAEARAHAPAPATVKSNSTGKESRP
jgi:cobalt-zinc-cadmium efflux system membrane fusion protein